MNDYLFAGIVILTVVVFVLLWVGIALHARQKKHGLPRHSAYDQSQQMINDMVNLYNYHDITPNLGNMGREIDRGTEKYKGEFWKPKI
ncbi:hypothetical protein EFT87_05605 [Schleiferilactobacillus harbinensis]|uniref:hypothetical protein n=1 Tax=Schleiferilactobacillus harbinensis TaxID=304207 RepID=UPI0021A77D7D|nr:hypothetical protein [Schleiferilactobacillus harbinensis]MCT2908132.1 hypothetical protein [Schleiferilactobacillus harbinensis]